MKITTNYPQITQPTCSISSVVNEIRLALIRVLVIFLTEKSTEKGLQTLQGQSKKGSQRRAFAGSSLNGLSRAF